MGEHVDGVFRYSMVARCVMRKPANANFMGTATEVVNVPWLGLAVPFTTCVGKPSKVVDGRAKPDHDIMATSGGEHLELTPVGTSSAVTGIKITLTTIQP